MFDKILIATDGSTHSIRAAKEGIELAKLSGGKVTALYVVDVNRAVSDVSANIANEVIEGLKTTMRTEESTPQNTSKNLRRWQTSPRRRRSSRATPPKRS